MLFSELHKIMMNKVPCVRFWGAIDPHLDPPLTEVKVLLSWQAYQSHLEQDELHQTAFFY